MRRLLRPQEPQEFVQGASAFQAANPCNGQISEGRRWEAFRNEEQVAYNAARTSLYANQQGLCAYCEILLADANQQIEHYVPKMYAQARQDWTLDFSNFLLCCKGGTKKNSPRAEEYLANSSTPANLSCGEKKGNTSPCDVMLNPYNLPEAPIFSADYHPDKGLALVVDEQACMRESVDPLLARNTLELLGLNCIRLVRDRGRVWRSMMLELEGKNVELPTAEQAPAMRKYAQDHLTPLDGKLQSYLTTRFIYLKPYLPLAELIEITRG